jgi:hypothetical protein
MSYRLPRPELVLVVISLLSIGIRSTGQDIKVELKTPYSSARYQTLSGTITFSGKRPKPVGIDSSSDPACGEVNPKLRTEYAEGDEGRLANVMVYVEGESLQTYNFESPTSLAVLEHRGCRFVPHVLGIRVGQPLAILNSDPTFHNTHPTPRTNPEWNRSQPKGGDAIKVTFKRPEKFIPFKDNMHPWQKAYLGVFDHPFFAVSDEQGRFKIEGLPPGQYRVVAWHERFGEQIVSITFLPDESRELTFDFTAAEL